MIKKLFYLFIFFAPFTSFFALSAWLRLPVVINQIVFLFLIVGVFQNNRVKTKWIIKEDLYLLAFLSLVWLSFILGFREKRSFNHSLAYTNSILFYFFLSKYVLALFKISSVQIAKIVYWSFITSSLIIILDFIGINYLDFSFRRMFSEADGVISNMNYYIRAGMQRVGGVAEEPGNMALFYNIYFGISLYYLHQKGKHYNIKWILFLFVVSHFAMLSNAGITLSVIAGIIIFALNKLTRLKITAKQLFWTLSIFATIILFYGIILFFDIGQSTQLLEEFLNKIFFNETAQYSSSGQRLKQWARALSNFVKHPIFGNGPGFGVNEDPEGYLSVYLTVLSDVGTIAFLLFIVFQRELTKKVMKLNVPIRNFLLFCIITSFLHLVIVADFYHAPIWILFVFIQLVYKEQKIVEL